MFARDYLNDRKNRNARFRLVMYYSYFTQKHIISLEGFFIKAEYVNCVPEILATWSGTLRGMYDYTLKRIDERSYDVEDVLQYLNEHKEFGNVYCGASIYGRAAVGIIRLNHAFCTTSEELAPQATTLTQDIFKHKDCPEWAVCAAVDAQKHVMYGDALYSVPSEVTWVAPDGGRWSQTDIVVNVVDWTRSLIHRENSHRLWCKQDSLVWVKDDIMQIEDYCIVIEMLSNGRILMDNGVAFAPECVFPTYVVPWTAEEAASFMFTPIEIKHDDAHFYTGVIQMNVEKSTVLLSNGTRVSLAELASDERVTHNGFRCGTLKHLVNGAWVDSTAARTSLADCN